MGSSQFESIRINPFIHFSLTHFHTIKDLCSTHWPSMALLVGGHYLTNFRLISTFFEFRFFFFFFEQLSFDFFEPLSLPLQLHSSACV
jgi:hypothetical protein